MESRVKPVTAKHSKMGMRRALLTCGIISSLYYVAINVLCRCNILATASPHKL